MNDKYVNECRFCGGTEFVETTNSRASWGSVCTGALKFRAARLYHLICLDCGSVARSYVKEKDLKILK